MTAPVRALLVTLGLLAIWQAAVVVFAIPPFLLPPPDRVLLAVWVNAPLLLEHGAVTGLEMVLGLLIGTVLGVSSALALAANRYARRWLMPVLVVSQALPVFALAPLLVLWFGYGLGSKVAMATLIIYFPVTVAFLDGLRRVDPDWLDLGRVLHGPGRGGAWAELRHIRIPAALPALASGLRVAAAVAPIGAVVGEWVGSSAGLGHLMLHANARMQIDVMFAALFVLALMAVGLYAAVDAGLRRALPWQPDRALDDDT